jgi:hypothetical protein
MNWFFAFIFATVFVNGCTNLAKDDTDPPGIGERSGMTLHTDAKTGCQYVGTPGFLGIGATITPRLDAQGKQLCTR